MDKKKWSLVRILLVASLALNVTVIGAVAGLVITGRSDDGRPQRVFFEFGPLGRILERDDRRAINDAMRSNGPRPLSRAAMKLELGKIAQVLRSEPFDPIALTELMGALLDRSTRVKQNAQAAFVAHLGAMSPAERVALADKLEREKL